MITYFHEKTNYSKLYSAVYWGSFKYDNEKDKDMDVIFHNRNTFAQEFKLKKALEKGKQIVRLLLNYSCIDNDELLKQSSNITKFSNINLHHQCDYYDHVEVYETIDKNIVILSSSYTKNDDKYKEFLTKTGFANINLLYNSDAISFYKVYTQEDINIIKNNLKNRFKNIKNK